MGRGGYLYSKMGVTLPLLYLPSVIVADQISALLSYPTVLHILISLTHSLMAALLATCFFVFFRVQRSNLASAILTLIVFGSSLLLPYSKTCHREILQALLLFLPFCLLETSFNRRYLFLSGLSLGLGILTKQAFIVPAFAVLLWSLKVLYERKRLIDFLCISLPVLFAALAWSFIADWIWGTPLATGYSAKVMNISGAAWKTPLLEGLWQQWFSSEKGIFVYCPLLLLIPFFWNNRAIAFPWAILAFVLQSLLYARWESPTGHEAYSARYLVVTLPPLLMGLRNYIPRGQKIGSRVGAEYYENSRKRQNKVYGF